MRKPLEGIRVLDLSRVLAGPWCTQQLADLGAEVIKVERPGTGDDTRAWGPPWQSETGESAYFLSANRGKRSVAIDLSTPKGQALVRDLVRHSDVLIENFRVGGLKAYGLDYENLKAVKADLVYCAVTGFGQDGPYAQRAGYDFLIQGMGGLMSLTGDPEGEPMKVGVAFADIFTGLYACNAILAALRERDRTGQGAYIDMALLDVQVGVLANQALNYLTSGRVPTRLGNAHPNIVPYQVFPTADGHIIIAVGNDEQFRRLCQVLDQAELLTDPRFATNGRRVENRDELIPLLSDRLSAGDSDHWLTALEENGVPAGPINDLDQVFADPQVRHRGMRIKMPDQRGGAVELVGNPIRFEGQRLEADRAPPLLGADTERVLADLLGLDEATLADLRRRGIIG